MSGPWVTDDAVHMAFITHFANKSGPSAEYPDPLPANGGETKRCRLHWRLRHSIGNNTGDVNKDTDETAVPVEDSRDSTGHVAAPQEHDIVQTNVQETSLELLSAAAEIKRLQQQVHQYELPTSHRMCYERQRASITSENTPSGDKPKPLTVQGIVQQESQIEGLFEYYTGFRYSTFQNLLQFLTIQAPQHHNNRKDIMNMEHEDQLLLTLMRLRHNFGLKDMAFRFSISTQAVSEVFLTWVDHMYVCLGSIPIWSHRNDIIKNMPAKYREEFPKSIVIIDCTELKTQKPSSLKLQSQMYSDYESSTTLKALVACDPMGNLMFVSELFTGSMSDKEITTQSGFYSLLQQLIDAKYVEKCDAVMADKGFTIKSELGNLGLNLNIPPFVTSGCQLTSSNVNLTQTIAQHRIHVERAFRRIRTFSIVADLIPTSVFGSINKIWTVCSLLTPWQNPVLKYK